MDRTLAYDLTRLFIGPIFLTPRGIDRVDLALARSVFMSDDCGNVGVLPTPWGVRAYPARIVRIVLAQLEQLWSENVSEADDPQLRGIIRTLTGRGQNPPSLPSPPQLDVLGRVGRMMRLLAATGLRLGLPVRRLPARAVYINVGQLGLAIPWFHHWLATRRDILCVMMLHDIIPLEYPHLVSRAAVQHHARMVETVARHADCLLFNTHYAKEGIDSALLCHRRVGLPGFVRALPLPNAFVACERSLPDLDEVNYFIVVSTVEPRKNHELLLRVWKRLIKRMGSAAPHLVIVGAKGFGADDILADLDRNALLNAHVHLVSGLSSAGLAALTLGATAMLSPSVAEGFGLPVFEAMALDVPVIASDIAAHREIASASVVLLPTDDESGWEEAVIRTPPVHGRTRPKIASNLTEADYCADVLAYVRSVDDARVMPKSRSASR
jgi:glycosyltransferase involved in cell wall biosynthesis